MVESKEELIGIVSYQACGPQEFEITSIVVRPEFQGQGIGKIIFNKILKDLADAKRLELTVHPDNVAALRLYQDVGFVVESQKENLYGDGEPRLLLY